MTTALETIKILKANDILTALEEKTDIDFCGLFRDEVITLIASKL